MRGCIARMVFARLAMAGHGRQFRPAALFMRVLISQLRLRC
jgi:hypothetical protein